MRNRSIVFALLLFVTIDISAATLHYFNDDPATYVTSVSSLEIGGDYFDVTFTTGKSYNNMLPFLTTERRLLISDLGGNFYDAVDAILAVLGTTERLSYSNTDKFWVVDSYHTGGSGPTVYSGTDGNSAMGLDYRYIQHLSVYYTLAGDQAWAMFEKSAAPVPIPAAVWLFGSGLLGLMGFSQRRRALIHR